MFQARAINEVRVFEGLREVGPTLSLVHLLLGHDNNNYYSEIIQCLPHLHSFDKTDVNVMLCCHLDIP